MAEKANLRLSRFPWWFWVVMAGLFAILVAALGWFLQSPAFQEMVRHRVIAELERATGGTVKLQSLTWNVSRLEIEAKGITIRGLEPGTEVPLAHADRLYVQLRVVSFLNPAAELRQLTLEQPVIHLIVKPDGTTNVPEPKVKSNGDPLQQLFDLAIGRAEVHNGVVLLNQQRIPFDFQANDLGLEMSYEPRERRYDGVLHVGRIAAQFFGLREIPAIADAEFSFWRNHAKVNKLKLTSLKSTVEASGTVEDFSHPKAQLAFSGNLDLGQAGEITRTYELRSGAVAFSGTGDFGADNFATSGKLTLRNVNYDHDGFAMKDAGASADFSLDQERIVLKRISGRMLGGTVTGDAEVKHYAPAMEVTTAELSSASPARPGKPAAGSAPSAKKASAKPPALPVMQGTANLKVGGASLMAVVKMLTSRDVPVEKLNLAGVVNGTVNLAFTGSISRTVLEIAADSVANGTGESGQLPVSGTFRGRYDVATSSTDIAALNLATIHTEASASGILRTHAADLKFAMNSNSLAEFQPLLSAMGQQPLPLEINGRVSLSGILGGPLAHPEIQGRLIATDVTYLYTPAVPVPHPTSTLSKLESALHIGHPEPEVAPARPSRRIHVDSFAGDLQYGPTLLALHNGVIEQSAMHMNIDGSVRLENGKFTDHSPIDLHAGLHNASLADLQRVAGSDYPVAGLLNGAFQVSGTRDDLHGQGTLALTRAEVHGHAVNVATADVAVVGQEVQFHNLRVEALGGSAAGEVSYDFANHQMRGDLRGENIDLAQITEIHVVPVQQHGTASFTVKVAGTPDLPQMEAHLAIADLVINDELAGGGLSFDLVSHGRNLQLTGRSHLANASLTVDGTIEMQSDLQSDLKLEFSKIDVDPLLRAHVKAQITKHSELAGRASLSGPLRRPRALKGDLLIDAFSVEVEHILLQTDGPVELGFHDGVLAVNRLMLTAEDSHVSLSGTVDLTGDRPLDLSAKGHINLGIIHTLESEINSYGTADQDVTIRGTLSKPVLDGRVVIAHAGFSGVDLPAALGELNGTMVFNQDRLEVEHLSGRVGGGQVNFGGFISYGDTLAFDLNSNGRDIRFRYGGVSVTADQELRLNGTLKSSTLSGVVTITRFAQIPAGDFSAAFVPQPAVIPDPRSPLNNLRLDVRIVSAPELTVQTSLAKLSGDVDMKLRGTGTRPTLLGRINIAEGEINLNGTKYHLDRGDITFANPIRIDPILDMEATTRVRDFDITIGLHGTLEKLTTTYRSDPPLSSDDIIALLAFGRTQEESYAAGRSSSLGQGAGSLVLGEAVNQVVSNRVSKLFGVSAIRINPAIGGPDNNPNARITVVQQVSNNVTLTYITNLTQSAQQVIQFEYNINANYTLQGVRDENGVVSFVVLIRARRK